MILPILMSVTLIYQDEDQDPLRKKIDILDK